MDQSITNHQRAIAGLERFMSRSAQSWARYDQPARSQVAMFFVIALVVTIGVILFSIAQYGLVTGEEFSAENFTRRQFTYYEVPVLGIQVLPIDRKDTTNNLERFLITEKLIDEVQTNDSQRRWDLIVATHGSVDGTELVFSEGQARILCSYLDAEDASKKNVWMEWSKQHQELAKIVWPVVAKLARQELYTFIPDLLLAARGASNAAEFDLQLDSLLAEKYLELAKTQQQLGRHEPAIELFTECIALAPHLPEAFAGRASSLAQLGEKDRANADLAQAAKMGTRR
jgi:tetratricopeptide (TPR) repeat protein